MRSCSPALILRLAAPTRHCLTTTWLRTMISSASRFRTRKYGAKAQPNCRLRCDAPARLFSVVSESS